MKEHAKLVDRLGAAAMVERLGGAAKGKRLCAAAEVARLIGERAVNVRQWKRQGVPWRLRPIIASHASSRGIPLPRDFLAGKKAAA